MVSFRLNPGSSAISLFSVTCPVIPVPVPGTRGSCDSGNFLSSGSACVAKTSAFTSGAVRRGFKTKCAEKARVLTEYVAEVK